MKQGNPQISIIMPVYNVEKYLEKSLATLLEQTFRDFELICVDDGSTDRSKIILESYKSKFRSMIILSQKNKGAGAARNTGMKKASGEYIFFMDADDLCGKNLLKKALICAKKTSADIVCFHFNRLYSDGSIKKFDGYHSKLLPEGIECFNYQDCHAHIMDVINPTPWNKLYKREFIIDNDLFFEEISSTNDITFAAVSCAKAGRIAPLDEVLYTYRVGHENTITSTKSKKIGNVVAAVESAIRQVQALNYYETIKPALASFVADNYIYSVTHYVKEYDSEETKTFYNTIHECFNSDLFSDTNAIDSWYQEKQDKFLVIKKYGYDSIVKEIKRKVIVSMTSYPKRIGYVKKALESIYCQTYQPNEVILWLAEEQFPNKEECIPESLLQLVKSHKLKIRWCDNLKPHKKYFYAFQENPEALIITVDDDLVYKANMIETLVLSYLLHPNAVSAVRTHLMAIDREADGTACILPYDLWIKEYDECVGKPSMHLLCTGGAGALYPAWLFDEMVFDKSLIMDICPDADDIWLKILETIAGIPVVLATKYTGLAYIEGSQEERLFDSNIDDNDIQLEHALSWVDGKYGEGYFMNQLMDEEKGENLLKMSSICPIYMKRIQKLYDRLSMIENTKAYKIGKPVTIYGRRCRDLLQRMIIKFKNRKM